MKRSALVNSAILLATHFFPLTPKTTDAMPNGGR